MPDAHRFVVADRLCLDIFVLELNKAPLGCDVWEHLWIL